jgi:hypothetical protein
MKITIVVDAQPFFAALLGGAAREYARLYKIME